MKRQKIKKGRQYKKGKKKWFGERFLAGASLLLFFLVCGIAAPWAK